MTRALFYTRGHTYGSALAGFTWICRLSEPPEQMGAGSIWLTC